MRKDNIEKEIENRTPINFKFSEIESGINYSCYKKPVAAKTKKLSWTGWTCIGLGACAAAAVAVLIPLAASGVIPGFRSGINENAGTSPDNEGINELYFYDLYQYKSEGLEVLNFGDAAKRSYSNISYNSDILEIGTVNGKNISVLEKEEYNFKISNPISRNGTLWKDIEIVQVSDTSKKVSYSVPFEESEVSNLKVKQIVKDYCVGGSFHDSDIEVQYVYGHSQAVLPSEYTVDYSSVDFDHIGTYPIKVYIMPVNSETPIKVSYNVNIRYADELDVSGCFGETVVDSLDSSAYLTKEQCYFNSGTLFIDSTNESYNFTSREVVDGNIYLKIDGVSKFVYSPTLRTLKDLSTNKTYSFISNNQEKVSYFNVCDLSNAEKNETKYVSNNGYLDSHIYKYLVNNYGDIYCEKKYVNDVPNQDGFEKVKPFGTYIENSGTLCFNIK